MNGKPPGVYSKLSREALVLMAGAYFGLYFLREAGILQEPIIKAQLGTESTKELSAHIEENSRLLEDIHSGLAPRDNNLVPQWSALRQNVDHLNLGVDRLTKALDRNSNAMNELRWEIQQNETPIIRSSENKPPPPKGWLQRLSDWFTWDSAG